MTLTTHPTYYDVLDLKPEASPQEIREGYLRIKNTYNKDSAALYTLISPEEREGMLRLIEEAYEILSHPEKRKEYDRNHGFISENLDPTSQVRVPNRKIISIDRVPPMDSFGDHSEDLMIAPSTDFSGSGSSSGSPFDPEPPRVQVASPPPAMSRPQNGPVMINPFMESSHAQSPVGEVPPLGARQKALDIEANLAREIENETDWSGLFLRRIREGRRISIEELSGITKITKTYLIAIEEENFSKLPAAVFVRGFLTQVARTLKLPAEKVVTAYLARHALAPSKKK